MTNVEIDRQKNINMVQNFKSNSILNLEIFSIVFIFLGFGILFLAHYFNLFLINSCPTCDSPVALTLAFVILGGILLLIMSVVTALFLMYFLIRSLFSNKQIIYPLKFKKYNYLFLGFSLFVLILGLVAIPFVTQNIHTNAYKSSVNLVTTNPSVESTNFYLKNIISVDLGTVILKTNNDYLVALKTHEPIQLPFLLDIKIINTTNDETLGNINIYARHSDDLKEVVNKDSNDYFYIYYRPMNVYESSERIVEFNSSLYASIGDVNNPTPQQVTIKFIEDPNFTLIKERALETTANNLNFYGLVISLSSIFLLFDILIILSKQKNFS